MALHMNAMVQIPRGQEWEDALQDCLWQHTQPCASSTRQNPRGWGGGWHKILHLSKDSLVTDSWQKRESWSLVGWPCGWPHPRVTQAALTGQKTTWGWKGKIWEELKEGGDYDQNTVSEISKNKKDCKRKNIKWCSSSQAQTLLLPTLSSWHTSHQSVLSSAKLR